MADEKFYHEMAFYGDYVHPGEAIKIERKIDFNEYRADLTPYVAQSVDDLTRERKASEAKERMIYDKLTALSKAWAEQASQTLILDKALDYLSIPTVPNTANQWTMDKRGRHEISNLVYKMSYTIEPEIAYRPGRPRAWEATWEVSFNVIERVEKRGGRPVIAGKKKKYEDKAAAEAYINGRIAAYDHLFTELSPPIPEDKVRLFRANGHLLRGYTVAPHEPTPDELLTFVDDHEISGVNLAVKPRRKAPTQKKAGKSR